MSWSSIADEFTDTLQSLIIDYASAPARDAACQVSPGLGSGTIGRALFYGTLALDARWDRAQVMASCEKAIDDTFDLLSQKRVDCSLYQGVAGVAWVLTLLHRQGLLEAQDDAIAQINTLLLEQLRAPIFDYDLILGPVGLGVYGLVCLPSAWGGEFLHQVVDWFAARAVETPEGTTWFTRPELLMPEERELYPQGNYNVGLAHGVPGVVSLLARVAAAGIQKERAAELARAGARWILAQRDGATFASRVSPEGARARARMAWCYGAPGIGVALLGAARALGDAALERQALAILLEAAALGVDAARIDDAGVCHGAAGLAHIFNRAYQATGEPALREAAKRWVAKTLSFAVRADDAVFFEALEVTGPERASSARLRRDTLLTGGAGVALALLSAASDVAPTWDGFLLTDIPAAPASGGQ